LIDVVLPLVITIISFIINLFLEEEVEENVLEKLLRDPKGHDLVEAHLKKEYSVENLYCWDDIEKYKNLGKEDVTLKSLTEDVKRRGYLAIHAKRICDKYFNGDKSLMELNVQKKDTDFLWRKLKHKKADLEFFDKILQAVKVNLSDSYSRIVLTREYKQYVAEKEVEQLLMEKDKKVKLGLIGYVRKLFGNFQRNVKRKASILGGRRGSSFRSNSVNESKAANDPLDSIHNQTTELREMEKKDVTMTVIAQPATEGDSEMRIFQSSNSSGGFSPQQQQQNSPASSSSSRQVIITESKRSAKSEHQNDKQKVSEIL